MELRPVPMGSKLCGMHYPHLLFPVTRLGHSDPGGVQRTQVRAQAGWGRWHRGHLLETEACVTQ